MNYYISYLLSGMHKSWAPGCSGSYIL